MDEDKTLSYNGSVKKFIYISLTLAILFFGLSIASNKIHAYITERKYDRVYEVVDDHLKVVEKKTLNIVQSSWYIPEGSEETFIIFNPIEGDPLATSKKELTKNSIKATDASGNSLKYTLEDTEKGNTIISVKIGKLVRYNEPYTLQIEYDSYGLLLKSGAIRDAYVPAFSKSYVFESDSTKEIVTTKLISKKEYGEINFSIPDTNIVVEGDNYILNYPQTSLIGDTVWVQIGKSQYYTFHIEQAYNKSTDFPFAFNTYKIVVPRDIQSGFINQSIFFTSISPEPSKIEQDADGNLIAYFKLPAVDSGKIKIDGYAVLNEGNEYDLTDSGKLSDIPASILARNTKNGKYWEVDTVEIQNVARDLKGSETDVYKLVEKTYKYVVDKIDYSDIKRFGINNRQGALKTLQGGAAVCMEYSDLFITLLRAMGIPARGAFGYGYSSLDYASINDGSINHQWAEVYLPKQNAWISADTTWGESGNLLIGGDLNHFFSHVAAVNPEIPSTTEVSYYGASPSLPERVMNVEIVEEKDIKNKGGETQSNLLNKYLARDSINGGLNNITDSVKLLWDRSESPIKALMIAIPFLILICIFVFALVQIRARRSTNSN